MKIFLCASRANYRHVHAVKDDLERRGHVVTTPNNFDDPGREERVRSSRPGPGYSAWKAEMLGLQVTKVEANDAVLVLNFDKDGQRNYIGGATFLEVFKAWELGRPVYFYNPLPDGILHDELVGMAPEVIHGDLGRIGRGSDSRR